MSYRPKRKLEEFDPNQSDPEDLDYGGASPTRSRPHNRSRKSKSTPRKPLKRRRETYGDSEDDIELDSDVSEEESFAESSEDDEQVELNPRTGRGVRSVAKKPIKYEESEEDSPSSGSDRDSRPPTPSKLRSTGQSAPRSSAIVKLKIPVRMEGDRVLRVRRGSKSVVKREQTPQIPPPGMKRRSSRLSHDELEPLVALTDSGRHEIVTRAGTSTPEPVGTRRPTRASKGLKKPPSAIMEASQETGQDHEFLSQLEEAAADADDIAVASPAEEDTQRDEDIHTEYGETEEHVVQESQPDPEDHDDDEGPVARSGRSLRARRKTSTPPASQASKSRRSLRNRKSAAEPSSDFEPDADGEAEAEEDVSDSDDLLKPPRGRSSNEGSTSDRRSGRLTRKTASQRSRSQRNASDDDADELDPEEIADEAAELDEDNRRNRRSRKRPAHKTEISFEPNLRNRGNRPDYRIFRPELALPAEDDDGPAATAATPQRNRRNGGGHTYRSLFSTFGPFGGAGGPPPVFGGPEGTGALGGADSDSSDDEGRGGQGIGGAIGMTPTSAFPKPFVPQTLNNDPVQGAGGGPPGLGKVRDKKALADADPLGVDVNVTFDGVGGLDDHIDRLREMVALPLLYPEVFQQRRITPPRGVLFHGPPGTGKTLLARALASTVSDQGRKVTFYMRKGADALSKWVGEAERQLRLLFEEARKNQPSIIFFDEIDGLAPVRSSKQEQIHASIVATLLALMDGMDGRGQVVVIGATNRPDSVDPALRRPGRFDREFYFPLPDEKGRRKILDIHTKGWDPPLKPEFKDELATLTRGYGGADLRALCTEAALNAVQGTYPQIYSSNQKLIIDPSTIKVLPKDFMISIDKIVPSSERSASSGAAPLKKDVEPLLRKPFQSIENLVNEIIPRKRKVTALEEAMFDDRDDELGFEKETMQRNFEASRIFRPRLLIYGLQGMGQQYLGAALLSKFEGLHVQNFDLATLLKDSTRSPEAAIVQMFEEVKRHKPSVIYIPDVNTWYQSLSDTVIRTFVGLLRSLPPTDPVLVLGIAELSTVEEELNADMVREIFGYSTRNLFAVTRPEQQARAEFFQAVVDMLRKAPNEFPDAGTRKRRKLEQLAIAPSEPEPKGPSKAELKAQKKKDRQTLNMLKLHIQSVMDQIKLKYKKFRIPIIDDGAIAYLYDEQNPLVLTTDLGDEQRQQAQLFRPYELDKDDKGVPGLREVASGKFYYNLEIVTIEKRLSNGYYKRPKDFLADIKRLAKDAKASGDQDRTLKANEMLANVEVDMTTLEQTQAALCAECEAVYERELERERDRVQKEREAQRRGEEVPKVVPNVPPPQASKATTESSGPVRLGQEIPGGPPLFPLTPNRLPGPSPISNMWSNTNGSGPSHRTNGSMVPSRRNEDSDMLDSQEEDHERVGPRNFTQSQGLRSQYSQKSAHTHLAHGSQLEQYENSASTTTSGQKTSDRSIRSSGVGTHYSNGTRHGDHPDFSMMQPMGGSQLPDTQPPSGASQSPSQMMGPPRPSNRQSVQLMLNEPTETNKEKDDDAAAQDALARATLIAIDHESAMTLHSELVNNSSGLSLEQLEQVNASIMDVIWKMRGDWNRTHVLIAVKDAFNNTIKDIEDCQQILDPSQRQRDRHRISNGH